MKTAPAPPVCCATAPAWLGATAVALNADDRAMYALIHNYRGDVVGLLNEAGHIVEQYSYDVHGTLSGKYEGGDQKDLSKQPADRNEWPGFDMAERNRCRLARLRDRDTPATFHTRQRIRASASSVGTWHPLCAHPTSLTTSGDAMFRTCLLVLVAGLVGGLQTAPAFADEPPAFQWPSLSPEDACSFCGVWTLDDDATIALQDVQLDHAALVYNAMLTLQFEMAFAPDATACMQVERRGERANEAIGWRLLGFVDGMWRVENVPQSGAPTEMFLAVDEAGNLVMRQPARLNEPLVFRRVAPAGEAAAWCEALKEVTP